MINLFLRMRLSWVSFYTKKKNFAKDHAMIIYVQLIEMLEGGVIQLQLQLNLYTKDTQGNLKTYPL